MDNNEPVYGTLHVFNSAICTPIMDIHGYITIKEINDHLLKVEQSDTKCAVRKKVHTISMSNSMAYYFIDKTGDSSREKSSINSYVQYRKDICNGCAI